jgi:hypothetical protein
MERHRGQCFHESHIFFHGQILIILQVEFPDWTLESIKETIHKRMAEEKAERK